MSVAQVRSSPEAATSDTALSVGAAILALCLEKCNRFPEWISQPCVESCCDSEKLFLTFGDYLADLGIRDPQMSLFLIKVGEALLAGGTLYFGYRLLKYVKRSLAALPEWMSFVYVVVMHFRQRKHLRSRDENDDLEPALPNTPSSAHSKKPTSERQQSTEIKEKRPKPAELPTKPLAPTAAKSERSAFAVPIVPKFAAKRPRPKGKLPYPGAYPLIPEPAYEGISGETAVFRMLWAFWHILVTHARDGVEDAEGHLILDFKAGELYAFAEKHQYGQALGSPERTEQILLDLIRAKRFPDNFSLAISPAPDSLFHTGPNQRVFRCTLDSMLDINGLWDPFEEDEG